MLKSPLIESFLFDFFIEKIGGYFYNQVLLDIHGLIYEKNESLAKSIYDLTKITSGEFSSIK